MDKIKINMVGGGFQHDICSSSGNVPRYVEWIKGNHNANISIHIDNAIMQPTNKTKKNYAWILESSDIIPNIIQWVHNNIFYLENNFELIFTHDKRLLPLSDKFRLIITNAVPWVIDRKIHKKTKLVSMIASTKLYCEGHRYRQIIVEKYKDSLDCFGTGRNRIATKEEGLNDYYFSFAIHNANYPNFFTEIITDCFATGTIPIYWGTSAINEFYNENGIIVLTDNFKLEDMTTDLYYSKKEAVEENFERVNNLPTAEDYIYENYMK